MLCKLCFTFTNYGSTTEVTKFSPLDMENFKGTEESLKRDHQYNDFISVAYVLCSDLGLFENETNVTFCIEENKVMIYSQQNNYSICRQDKVEKQFDLSSMNYTKENLRIWINFIEEIDKIGLL